MRRDDEFRPKLGKPRGQAPRSRFARQVLKAVERHATNAAGRITRRSGGKRSRGTRRLYRGGGVALRLKQMRVSPGHRRVVVKARIVRHGPRSTLSAHLKYLKRDGVTRDGAPGRLFDATSDDIAEGPFIDRTKSDRHHFRFMVSPEDGDVLTDLKAFTRDLMAQMEADLETKLTWMAIGHYNTDNPHVHVTVRGIDDQGRDLVIDRDYITLGLRARAQDLVTLELGLRTEREIEAKHDREVEQERFTGLDRALLHKAHGRVIDMRPEADDRPPSPSRSVLLGRLSILHRMGLTAEDEPGQWRLAPELESTLRALGERGDIVKAMNRALTARGIERAVSAYAIHDIDQGTPVTGRIVDKGLADELNDTMCIVVDGIDGRVHCVESSDLATTTEIPVGAIVQVGRETVEPRSSDTAIAEIAAENDGLYRPSRHLALARGEIRVPGGDYESYVEAHVRRLEALRRTGIVQRIDADRWQVPADLVDRGVAYDARRRGRGIAINVVSMLDLEAQVTAPGATWLDRQLVGRDKAELSETGFGADVRQAMEGRTAHLIDRGLASRRNTRVLFARALLATLEDQELEQVAQTIGARTGLAYCRLADGESVRGTLRQVLNLNSGRFAVIDNIQEFALVPWRPILDRSLGQQVNGIMRGRGVSWSPGRERDQSL